MSYHQLPSQNGLYHPGNEHDACGVGFVAHTRGQQSHAIIEYGLTILQRLHHRGAVGADPRAGDGAGLLLQLPDQFLRAVVSFDLPEAGYYAVGQVFLPQESAARHAIEATIRQYIEAENQQLIGWRTVPVNNAGLGHSVLPTEPVIRQVFIKRGAACANQDAFERKLFVIRKQIENQFNSDAAEKVCYFSSLSSRTLVYKGMLLADQVGEYYPDLQDERMVSALALVHQRFSTNTFPTWDLAHPFRMIAHNGEINTVRGNVNWMAARRHAMHSDVLGDDLDKIWPLIPAGQSDTACFDNALELLVMSGYSLAEAMMMLIPEAWEDHPEMDAARRAFYEYHAALMEPWDGPAAVAFTDGRQIGATLDRNGLRPARYVVTDDDLIVLGSEVGVLPIPEHKIVKKWRLQPGKMLLIDLEQGGIIDDDTLKQQLSKAKPYQDWLDQSQIHLEDQEPAGTLPAIADLLSQQQAFGYTQEDLKIILAPMILNGQEATGSMGADNPPAVLSRRAKHLSHYFKQLFAQVTNPPIDPIRESIVMSLVALVGPRPNLLGHDNDEHKRLECRQPILTNTDLACIRHLETTQQGVFRSKTLALTYPATQGAGGMAAALQALCAAAEVAVQADTNILILSDRQVSADQIAIPALLATSAVHHHLIQQGLRTETGLVVETGAALEVHHFATLAGYGAEAINPYLALATLQALQPELPEAPSAKQAEKNYIQAIGKGLLKVMSKMGISTYQSYCGAQIFDAVGLHRDFVAAYFPGTHTAIDGIGLPEVAATAVEWHQQAYGNAEIYRRQLDVGGDYALRLRGEDHMWTPATVSKLQHAVRSNNAATYAEYAQQINEQNERLLTLRGLMRLHTHAEPLSLDEIEPASEIVKRFSTGAMSFGSISHEAHTTLAKAMNQIGGKSNTGEGGEEPARFQPLADGQMNPERSAIKQVASGRFGVTTEYLVNADDIQIKMAQGAKPGEGGQLPGHKVNQQIARVRHSTPGVGLISPPPHHDIYSIEDLAQLIHDLKNVQPKARISVKLVSEIGVGTVAAGVSKAHADHITIAGYDGGTGASPLTSLKHAGSPWEIGLAETQQTLVLNRLRSRVSIQADGGMRTGRDVVIAALLGADEIGFSTAPLIAEGCIMMRKCHLNTCPVGIATQDPELRQRFTGQPEHVINYFFFVAEEVRQLMAELGFRTFREMVGQSDRLDMRTAIDHWKAKGLDYSRLLHPATPLDGDTVYCSEQQDHGLEQALDRQLIAQAKPALEQGQSVEIDIPVDNTNRTVGTMLSGRVAERYGHAGLPADTIQIRARGIGGQSFGAWLAHGITLKLSGEANDYVGKGLSGGKLIIAAADNRQIERTDQNVIAGNTVLFGAISGHCYIQGVAGERFAVRNSGAHAVVEGVGDHGCEYMTGGVVVVLGETGRNFAAGMSGGIAYVLDRDGQFKQRCNLEQAALETIDPADTGTAEQVAQDPLRYDASRLYQLIQRHAEYTGSTVAHDLLNRWEDNLLHFRKVVPVDYCRALLEHTIT
jgi:glutamate synthase (NADPH/NADH) large chain